MIHERDEAAPARRSLRRRKTRTQIKSITGRDVLSDLMRTRVRDDGSCWNYAVLAGLHMCEHAKREPFKRSHRSPATEVCTRRTQTDARPLNHFRGRAACALGHMYFNRASMPSPLRSKQRDRRLDAALRRACLRKNPALGEHVLRWVSADAQGRSNFYFNQL